MKERTRNSLLSRGLRSDLVEKIGKNGHTVNNLKSFNKVQLGQFYTPQETEQIETAVKRQPIPEETVTELLRLSTYGLIGCHGILQGYGPKAGRDEAEILINAKNILEDRRE